MTNGEKIQELYWSDEIYDIAFHDDKVDVNIRGVNITLSSDWWNAEFIDTLENVRKINEVIDIVAKQRILDI